MSDPELRDDAGSSRTAFRGRLIFLVTVPVLLLGGSYFLFIEYLFARPEVEFAEVVTALRIGGAAFITLGVVLALCCGFVVVGRMTRSTRLLLRFIETGSLPSGAISFLYRSDWDAFYLFRRIQALFRQSRSEDTTVSELQSLNSSLIQLKTEIEGGGVRGLAESGEKASGVVGEITERLRTNRRELAHFFGDLRAQTESLRAGIEELRPSQFPVDGTIRPEPPRAHLEMVTRIGNGTSGHGGGNGNHRSEIGVSGPDHPSDSLTEAGESALDQATERIRQLGSVLALEMERVGPDPDGLGLRYQRFAEALETLESAVADVSPMKAGSESADEREEPKGPDEATELEKFTTRWRHLEESLGILQQRLDEVADR